MAFPAIADAVAGLLTPIAKLVDDVHTSKEEKAVFQLELAKLQVGVAQSMFQAQAQELEARRSLIEAEAKGGSWLQRSWRPITALAFAFTALADAYGFLPNPLAPQAWNLLTLMIGGYVGGRTIEKVAPGLIEKLGDVKIGGKK